jgi:hypothetical protein
LDYVFYTAAGRQRINARMGDCADHVDFIGGLRRGGD